MPPGVNAGATSCARMKAAHLPALNISATLPEEDVLPFNVGERELMNN